MLFVVGARNRYGARVQEGRGSFFERVKLCVVGILGMKMMTPGAMTRTHGVLMCLKQKTSLLELAS